MNSKKITYIIISILFLTLLIFQVSANTGQVCDSFTPNLPSNRIPNGYDVRVDAPISISSQQVGSRERGCGAAVFSSALERTNPLNENSQTLTQQQIINICSTAGHIQNGGAGTFQEYLDVLIDQLKKDPLNYYQITVMRINNFTDTPILTRPTPSTNYYGTNVRKIEYKPYNFGPSDITEGMRKVNAVQGGIVLGGVEYDQSNNEVAAHMVQPRAIESQGHMENGIRVYDIEEYDPYFGRSIDVYISKDHQGKWYADFWSGPNNQERWFHLEEFLFVEKLGPFNQSFNWTRNNTGSSGGSSRVVRGPTTGATILQPPQGTIISSPRGPITPTSCGTIDRIANMCIHQQQCPANQYCSYDLFCTCKTPRCGDNIRDPGEQCDDGNLNNNDGCSAQCTTEFQCGANWINHQPECLRPGNGCLNIRTLSVGLCSNDCRCNPLPVPIR